MSTRPELVPLADCESCQWSRIEPRDVYAAAALTVLLPRLLAERANYRSDWRKLLRPDDIVSLTEAVFDVADSMQTYREAS